MRGTALAELANGTWTGEITSVLTLGTDNGAPLTFHSPEARFVDRCPNSTPGMHSMDSTSAG